MPLSFSFCVLFFFHQGVQKKVDVFNNFLFALSMSCFPSAKKVNFYFYFLHKNILLHRFELLPRQTG